MELERKIATFKCGICMETTLNESKFVNLKECKLHEFCQECIITYTELMIMESGRLHIICPGLECQVFLDPISCKPLINPQVFDRWVRLLSQATQDIVAISSSPKRIGKLKSVFTNGWRGIGCVAARDATVDASFKCFAVSKGWQRCPQCGYYVERISGCNHIRCRCGTKFCYGCGHRVCYRWCAITSLIQDWVASRRRRRRRI